MSYSLTAAEDREKQLTADHAAVRIVEVAIGQDVPATVLAEMRTEAEARLIASSASATPTASC
ncbi:hypothetical protein [Streptomyces crystallinus]|uniref:hypothetical protein n=1 Tax=Streptomyces crystallinus TaxID=68191 RepID=UPI0031CF5389